MKWLLYVVLILLVGGSWVLFSNSGKDLKAKQEMLEEATNAGDQDAKSKLEGEVATIEGERTFQGILLAFLSAGLVGIVFVFQILPMMAHKMTHAIYDSAEMMEDDVMREARSLIAQGDYHGAIASLERASAAEPLNRLPIVEIAKIHKDNLGDPQSAIDTIRGALEDREWEPNDAAYFLFRLAELYDQEAGHRPSAVAIMQQVVDEFPGTRHSANAMHKLHEWEQEEEGVEEEAPAELAHLGEGEEAVDPSDEEARLAAEEAEVMARLRAQEEGNPEESPQDEQPGGSA